MNWPGAWSAHELALEKRAMQSIVQLPKYYALNKLRLRTRRSRAPITKCALINPILRYGKRGQ